MRSTEIWLRMTGVRHLGARRAWAIVRKLIDLNSFDNEILRALGLSDTQIAQFCAYDRKTLEETLNWLSYPNHRIVTCEDVLFPFLLSNIRDFPLLLFVSGSPELLASPQISIIGSRESSAYGERWGCFFAQELAANELTVTSGLAIGIDGIAHRAALGA